MTLLVAGTGAWPAATLLERFGAVSANTGLVVIDRHGAFEALRRAQRGGAAVPTKTLLGDLADLERIRRVWDLDAHLPWQDPLRHLVAASASVLGAPVGSTFVEAVVEIAGVLLREAPGTAGRRTILVPDLLRSVQRAGALRALGLPRPVLATCAAADATAWVAAWWRALRYAPVYAALCADVHHDTCALPAEATEHWWTVPRGHLEPAAWRVLNVLIETAVTQSVALAASLAGPATDLRLIDLHPPWTPVPPPWLGATAGRVQVATSTSARTLTATPRVRALFARMDEARWWLGPGAGWDALPELRAEGLHVPTTGVLGAGEMAAVLLRRGRIEACERLSVAPPGEEEPVAVGVVSEVRVPARTKQPAHLSLAAEELPGAVRVTVSLIPRIAAPETLHRAWLRVRAQRGIAGTDGVALSAFASRLELEIEDLARAIADGTYRPRPFKRVQLPKEEGGTRPIAVLAVRDRVAQAACLETLEPVLEPTFLEPSHGFRTGRGPVSAMHSARRAFETEGYAWAVKADIRKCFDSLDHDVLLARLHELTGDPDVVRLIAHWVRGAVVLGPDVLYNELGVPQGASLSPMLANVYLTPFDEVLLRRGERFLRYADDILVACRDEAHAAAALDGLQRALASLKLQLHPDKTRVRPFVTGVEFLGCVLDPDGLRIQPSRADRFIAGVRSALCAIRDGHAAADPWSTGESLKKLLASVRGFGAYFRGLADDACLHTQLAQLDARIADAAAEILPESVRQHPAWEARVPMAPVRRSAVAVPAHPAAGYVERSRIVAAPEEGRHEIAAPRVDAEEHRPDLARGVSFESGALAVLRHGAYLSLKEGRLVVRRNKETLGAFAVADLRSVHVSAGGATLAARLCTTLVEAGIPVLLTDPVTLSGTLMGGPVEGRSAVRRAQALAAEGPTAHRLALAMLRAKIGNQAGLLRYYGKYLRRSDPPRAATLDAAAAAIRAIGAKLCNEEPGSPRRAPSASRWMGFEGSAAARYWEAIGTLVPAPLAYPGRQTRNAADPVNQSLNYAYGALYLEVWRALVQAGLDPGLGLLHHAARERPSLVFDVIEEFRAPFADRVVWSLLGRGWIPRLGRDGRLTTASRRRLSAAMRRHAARLVRWRGRKRDFAAIVQFQARSLAMEFQGGARYLPYHFRW